MSDPRTEFEVGKERYRFEIEPPLYTHRPQQPLNQTLLRFEDRYHRTVKITRLSDSHSWIGAADFKPQYMNDFSAYLRSWLEDCFARWDLAALPVGFEIPQGQCTPEPETHYCPIFPVRPLKVA